jgi:hypothetical protein
MAAVSLQETLTAFAPFAVSWLLNTHRYHAALYGSVRIEQGGKRIFNRYIG